MGFRRFSNQIKENQNDAKELHLSNSFPVLKVYLYAILLFMVFSHAEAFDPLDPFGNITIKWDVVSWTPDGYVAVVTMNNFQMYRHIMSPGWSLQWSWAKKEVIWSIVGAQATEQGDCSKFKGSVPHCCKKTPTIVDLLPGVPYNQQYSNCCKSGVVSSWGQDPTSSVSAFQVSVGLAGTSNKTVKLPKNFTLYGPGPGYTCGPANIVPSTVFLTPTPSFLYRGIRLVVSPSPLSTTIPSLLAHLVLVVVITRRTVSCKQSFLSPIHDSSTSCTSAGFLTIQE